MPRSRQVLAAAMLLVCTNTACRKTVAKSDAEAFDAYIDALPALKAVPAGARVILNVRYVEHPNLPTLSTAARAQLYRTTETAAKKVFGYDLTIRESETLSIANYFARERSAFKEAPLRFPAESYLISWFASDRDQQIQTAVASALKKQSPERLREYLGTATEPAAVSRNFIARLKEIYAEAKVDGQPLLAATNAAEEIWFSYGHWDTLALAERGCDFTLTNIGIIGADTGMPLYVIARGGVTSAFVENNAHRPYQASGVLALYPLLADTPIFQRLRGALTIEQKEEAIVWVWLHELGHMLLKKEENYTFADSVHRAPPDLRYYEWVKRVKNSRNQHSNEIAQTKKF